MTGRREVLGVRLLLCFVAATAAAQPQTPDYGQKCSTAGCHGDLGSRKVVHNPVSVESCDACHEKKEGDAHAFKLVAAEPALCLDCHDEYKGKVVHQPVSAGTCTTCHDPHGGAVPKLLTAPPAKLCGDCHEAVPGDVKHVHGPVAVGECGSCHNPHASENAALLIAAGAKLCIDCHSDIEERIADSKYVHPPVQSDCGACHDPHGTDAEKLLKAAQPKLCLECHEAIDTVMNDAAHPHAPMKTGESCAACHDAHASSVAALLRKPSMELCLSCHTETITTGSRTVADIGKLLKENPNHHGPIQQKDCGPCHDPHGGERPRLLKLAYPDKLYVAYADESYALCFECHDTDAFTERETDSATAFRNGTLNLHYLHVNQPTKGRSCRACHEPHAAANPKHIHDGVAFGKWTIPINFRPTATGGSCASGCHRPYRYDREKPVARAAQPPG